MCACVKAFECKSVCAQICLKCSFACKKTGFATFCVFDLHIRRSPHLRFSYFLSSHQHHIAHLRISDPHISDFHILHLHIRRSPHLSSSYFISSHLHHIAHLHIPDLSIFTFIFRSSCFETTFCFRIFGSSSRSHTVLSYHFHDFILVYLQLDTVRFSKPFYL